MSGRAVASVGSVLAVLAAAACGGSDGGSLEAGPETSAVETSSDVVAVVAGACSLPADVASMARLWNEVALDAIRADFPAPTVHARNLFHLSAASWDAWRAFESADSPAAAVLVDERRDADDVAAARDDAIAFASHRLLSHRYRLSLARADTQELLDTTMREVCGTGDAEGFVADRPESAAAFGWAVAGEVIDATFDDGALERRAYEHVDYDPVNPPLEVAETGAGDVVDPDRWQPLLLEVSRSQNGLPLPGGEQTFIGSNWGGVEPFALRAPGSGATELPHDTPDLLATTDAVPPAGLVDPPAQPRLADDATADAYRAQAIEVLRASSELEVGAATIDIGPSAYGDNTLGVDDGDGHDADPTTGEPYESNVVDAADYYRAIAEYWADGPTSETPPGHWNSLAHTVSDRLADADRRVGGEGEPVDRLAWDVALGLALNGALHDAAIAAWGTKAHYDSVRPITMIRWMAENGPYDAAINPTGLPLEDGLVEVVTDESASPGERHAGLADHVGAIAIRSWRGSPTDAETETAGVGWILGADWVPYQRATFVTPAFASYVSGHSVFSRAGAEVLAGFTGSDFFPGGMLVHEVPVGSLLHEEGPSESIELQWATYFDASDEAGRSRIWGGIHIEADDRVGRQLGSVVGRSALAHAFDVIGDR